MNQDSKIYIAGPGVKRLGRLNKELILSSNAGRQVVLWGTGSPRREFLHVDDLAKACLFFMENYQSEEIINVASGIDSTIKELVGLVREIIGYEGEVCWYAAKPDGTMRKLSDVSKMTVFGWRYDIGPEDGIRATYRKHFKN